MLYGYEWISIIKFIIYYRCGSKLKTRNNLGQNNMNDFLCQKNWLDIELALIKAHHDLNVY